MRILWLHQYFATPQGWGSTRTYELAQRFAAAGHTVDIVCSAAYDASLAGVTEAEIAPGVRAFVSRVRYSPHMGFAARVLAFVRFMLFALRFVRRHGKGYDLAIASSAPLNMAVPALAGVWRWRLPYVFEVIDVWPDAAIAAGVLRNRLLQWLSFRLEDCAYRHAAHIVTCSSGMSVRVVGKGVPAAKVTTIPNGCDLARFAPDPAVRTAKRREAGVAEGQLVCIYTGAMGRSNAIEDVVETVRRTLADARIVWWFVGEGPAASTLRDLDRGDGRVRFLGMRPHRELPGLLAGADVALVTFMHAPLFEENSPNKFFDAIAAGLPVIFNRSTWLAPEIMRSGCGFVCTGDAPAAEMARRLQELADDPVARERMGAAARRLAGEVFDRDAQADAFRRVIEAAVR